MAIKRKKKITDAEAIIDAGELKNEVKAIAANLNRSKEFDIDNATDSQLIEILQRLSASETQDVTYVGKYYLPNLKRHLSANSPAVQRLDPKTRQYAVKRIKVLLRQQTASLNSFKSLAFGWAEKKKWGREKSKKTFG